VAVSGPVLVRPPVGVETKPQEGRPTLTTAAAGRLLGLTAARVRQRVVTGELPGGAEPRPRRPRYYVYADEPLLAGRGGPGRGAGPAGQELARLRARVQELETVNLMLLASEEGMRLAAEAAGRAAVYLRQAEAERAEETRQVRLADRAKAEAVSVMTVPGDAAGAGG